MLQDPSRLVRLAAAATLAYHRDASGDDVLVEGLEHERWEIRWWCARCLAYFGDAGHLPLIQARRKIDPDPFVRDQLEDMERSAILKALEQTRYNKTAAAKVLGMSFRALRYRIKKLGIE